MYNLVNCANRWNEIKYPHVPSKAMSAYTNAFKKHDFNRFEEFKGAVEKGEAKINASVLFPHDCIRTHRNGDQKTAELQFNALPNYLEGTDQRIMVLADTSLSMDSQLSGNIRAVDVCIALALYCSDRLGKSNPFYRKFTQFCDESEITDWQKYTFTSALNKGLFNRAAGSTQIDTALDMLLSMGQMFNATPEQMPNTLLIVSDMQFSEGAYNTNGNEAAVGQYLARWEDAGFQVPKIVYWNLAGYAGSPDTVDSNNVGLVSGFSPAILKAVFSSADFTPIGIMNRAIEKYQVKVPA